MIARKKGFQVSNTGYFVYVDGQHRSEQGMLDRANPRQAWMRFNVAVIPYEGSDEWVGDALRSAKPRGSFRMFTAAHYLIGRLLI